MSKLKCFIFIFLCHFFLTLVEGNEEDAVISIGELLTKSIGRKGAILLESRVYDPFIEDPIRKICFQAKVSNEKYVDCGIYKPKRSYFYIFWNIGTDIPAGNHSLNFTDVPTFQYQGYNIKFDQYGDKLRYFEKLDRDIIDIYSRKQTIHITKYEHVFKLKFNVVSYNQEILMIPIPQKSETTQTPVFIYMDCIQDNNELNCSITKDELEKGLIGNYTCPGIYYINDMASNGLTQLPLVEEITILDKIEQKIDVSVGITRLIENVAEGNSIIAYETNVTKINKVARSDAKINVRFKNEYQDSKDRNCYLKKYDDNPLMIVCFPPSIGKCWLKGTRAEIIINNVHIKYNFIIQPFKNEEKIYHSKNDPGTYIKKMYPEILDFTKRDSFYVYYDSKDIKYLKGITFNEDKGDLFCEERQKELLRCLVPRSHFEKSGYYFTKHTNHLDGKSIFYEIPPVKVILKGGFYSISLYYSLLLILIMY